MYTILRNIWANVAAPLFMLLKSASIPLIFR
jgi:hypothetical protein